jgi:membrane protease YdiL (CAAX protease family)
MNDQIRYSIENIKTSNRELWLQIFIVFVLPILLIKANVIEVDDRIWVLGILISLLMGVLIKEKWTWTMLGATTHRFKKYFVSYALFTVSTILLCYVFSERIGHEELLGWWKHGHFLYGFFIVSLFQEIGYRGYLIPALGKILKKPVFIVFVNALLFMFLHVIFPNPLIGLPLAFIGGVGFALMYMRYPSLPLIIVSHALINFFVVLYGFFVVPGLTY